MDLDLYAYKDYRTDPKTQRRVWRGTWFYLIVLPPRPDGRRPQLKRRGFATKGAALDAGREAVAALRAGQAPPTAVVVPPPATAAGASERESLTVEEYLEGWLAAIRVTVDGTTWKNYRTVLRSYVIPWIGHRQLSWLSDDDLSAHYGDLLARGGHRRCVTKDGRCEQAECDNGRPLSRTTVRLVHRVLHKALYDGYKILPVNPAEHARVPKKVSRIMTTWTEQELNRFLAAMVNDRLFAAWYIALTAGLRRGELAGLRWANVHLDHGFISVVTQRTIDTDGDIIEKDPKGSSLGPVAIGPAAVTVLRTHRRWQQQEAEKAGELWQPSDYVFVQENGEPYNPPALLRRFKRLCGLANVPVIRLHDARHTCATIVLMAGEHPKIVQERLRHASYQTTMNLYSHVSPTMQTDAARRIENIANGQRDTRPADQAHGRPNSMSEATPDATRHQHTAARTLEALADDDVRDHSGGLTLYRRVSPPSG